ADRVAAVRATHDRHSGDLAQRWSARTLRFVGELDFRGARAGLDRAYHRIVVEHKSVPAMDTLVRVAHRMAAQTPSIGHSAIRHVGCVTAGSLRDPRHIGVVHALDRSRVSRREPVRRGAGERTDYPEASDVEYPLGWARRGVVGGVG